MAEQGDANLQSELASFRQNWRLELHNDGGDQENRADDTKENAQLSLEERATQLFLEGARYEKEGQMTAAVYYYRQAVHLVPDIEFKIAESNLRTDDGDSSDEDDSSEEIDVAPSSLRLDTMVESLTESMSLVNITGLCSPETPQTETHISVLPTELLSALFRWVVSKDIDVKSLGQLALVCKWFYICARDVEIWKNICLRVWGINCDIALYNNSWRQMYLERPHVKLNGVYISTNTYVRIGEPAVGHHYNPVSIVKYYKYLRFFSDGTVLVYTSAEDPQGVVQMLNRPPFRDPSIYKGYYRLSEMNKVNVFYMWVSKSKNDLMRRGRGSREKPDVKEHHFFMTLSLNGGVRRRNTQLMWENYYSETRNPKTGECSECDIPINAFKPYIFSGVRSYLTHTTCPI